VPVKVRHAEGQARVTVNQRKKPPIEGAFISLGKYPFRAGDKAIIEVSNKGTDGHVILDAVQLVLVKPSGEE
jgi:hypothetical protein